MSTTTKNSTTGTPSAPNNSVASTSGPTTDATPAQNEVEKKVTIISSKSQFDLKISEAGNKLVVVEFYAQWCGPCKIIGTKLEELAGKFEDQAMIIKLDVDECEDIAIEYNVTSMPTFIFLRNKKKINQLIGSNGEKLIENVEKFCMESTPNMETTEAIRPSNTTVASTTKKVSTTAARASK